MEWKAPRNFDEYLAAYPIWHKSWLVKHYPNVAFSEEGEDVAQHLLLRSIETQRVEKYKTLKRRKKGEKDTPGLFFHWMGTCFKNDMHTRYNDRLRTKRRAMEGTVSIESLAEFGRMKHGDDAGKEALSLVSQNYRLKAERQGRMIDTQAQIEEFRSYVLRHRPDLLPALDDILAGVSRNADRIKLRDLAKNMIEGRTPNKAPRRRSKDKKWGAPRVYNNITKEKLEELAARGLKMREARKELGCSHSLLWWRCKELTGRTWKSLVLSLRSQY
jgi:hypothetical protein